MNLFFDLDGTLTDPKVGMVKCFQYALSRLKFRVSKEEELIEYIGSPLHDSFAQILATDDESIILEAIGYYRELYSKEGVFETSMYDGIENLLRDLSAKSHTLFVATTKPTYYARKVTDHINITEYFKEVYGSELNGIRANKADLIRYILDRESIKPETAIMIGDRKYDVLGAAANSVKSISVLWGYGSREELAQAGAYKICGTPEELLALFGK